MPFCVSIMGVESEVSYLVHAGAVPVRVWCRLLVWLVSSLLGLVFFITGREVELELSISTADTITMHVEGCPGESDGCWMFDFRFIKEKDDDDEDEDDHRKLPVSVPYLH